MSLNKAVEHGKEKRKPYRGAKAIDCTCRNHGSCAWCRDNRMYSNAKMIEAVEQWYTEWDEETVRRYVEKKGRGDNDIH